MMRFWSNSRKKQQRRLKLRERDGEKEITENSEERRETIVSRTKEKRETAFGRTKEKRAGRKAVKKKEKKKKKETQLQHLASTTEQESSSLCRVFADLHLTSESEEEESQEEDTCCPKCGLVYADSDGVLWVCCDSCELWYDLKCTGIRKRTIPDLFYCNKCVKKH